MKTAVIYARFSCSKQREASIDDQLRVCAEWCAANGYAVVGQYCDYAISGRTDDRPEFQRMIAAAGESDVVVVYMMDRFSRDVYDAPIYKKRLRDAGVRVVSATEALPDGPESILLENIYEAMAAMESAHISQRTRRGMEGNALKCGHNGVRVYGYRFADDGTYEVDDAEAAIVRGAFDLRLGGATVNAVADYLAAQGVRSYAGNPAGYSMARNMLANEKYAGVYSWGSVRVEGGMPAIVDRATFDAVQGLSTMRRGRGADVDGYPLSGRVVCGACGGTMAGSSGYGRNGTKYRYYRCTADGTSVRAPWLEDAVHDAVRSVLDDREAAVSIASALLAHLTDDGASERITAAEKRMVDAERRMANLTRAVAQGMPYDDAAPEMERCKVEYAAAAASRAMDESAGSFDVGDFADFLQFGATLDRGAVLASFVHQVLVLDGEVVVTLLVDDEKGDPLRLSFPAVRPDVVWLPWQHSTRNMRIAVSGGAVLIAFAA